MRLNATLKAYYALIPILIFIMAAAGCQADTSESETTTTTTVRLFTIVLDSNNGTDATADFTVEVKNSKAKCTLPQCTFEPQNGATFSHWCDASDDSGTRYDASEDVTFQAKKGTDGITLYAIWSAAVEKYFVEYDPNNGTDQTTGKTTFYIGKAKALKTIENCGFTAPATNKRFACWTTKADGSGKSYSDGQKVTNLTSAGRTITLYAQWELKTYFVITYHDDKNAANTNDTTFDLTHPVTLTDLDGIAGYTFGGWYDASHDGTKKTGWAAGEVTDDIELWARWNANTYKITFDKNGGDGTMSNQNMTYDVTADLTANTFTRSGFRFIGWNTADNASSPQYTNKQTVKNLTATANGVVTLYAIWEEAETYTVTFNKNGGSGTMDSVTFVIDEDSVLPKCAFKAPTGKIFDRWNTASDGIGTFYDNMQTVNGLAAKDAAVMLYAQWVDKAFLVVYFNDEVLHTETLDQTFDKTQNVTLPTPTVVPGWTFGGWYDNAEFTGDAVTGWSAGEVEDDITLYAKWTHNVITYTFDANGGKWSDDTTADKTVNGYYGETVDKPSDPIKTGWTFDGWNGSVSGDISELPTSFGQVSQTYTAKWILTYTIAFNANGGSGTMSDMDMVYGVETALTENAFTRSGWTFYGWDTSSDGTGTLYTDGQIVSNLIDEQDAVVTLYAIWQTATPDVGYICYNNSGSKIYSDCYLSGLTPLGVVFEVGTKVKIIYPDEDDGCSWYSAGGGESTQCLDVNDGSVNTDKVCGLSDFGVTYWPFYYARKNIGNDWYVPATMELSAINSAKTKINPSLTLLKNAGVSAVVFIGSYWSSTTMETAGYAYYMNNGSLSTDVKTRQYKVRAVMAF